MIKLKTLLLEDILLEGRIEDFNKKYEMLQPELRRRIILNDPSSNKKYIDWIGKIASSEPNTDIEDLLKDVNQFDKYHASLGDIYKLKSYNDLKLALSTRVKSNKEKTREGANMILDDEEFLIVAPTTHESCAYYGNNTKWCIVASEKWWNNYYYKETIIILLDKRDNQKYAITGDSNGDYTVYEKNDNTISYSNMIGDGEYQWPEYVQEAIENYMSSDDPESRKNKYDAMLIDEFVKNEGTDSIWKSYVDNLNREYKLEDSVSSLNDFKVIANGYGLDTDKLDELAKSFVWEQLISGGDVDDLGYFRDNEDLRRSLNDMGNEPKIKDTLEQIDVDYAHNQRNIDGVLEILQQAIPPQEYTRLYNNGTIDEEIFDAITKYNKMLNSQQQQIFATSKESVQIRNINDIIFVLKRTGHENVAGYLETLIGIKENKMRHIKLKSLLFENIEMDEVMSSDMVGIHELTLFYDNANLNTQLEVDDLLETGHEAAAWDIINNFLRTIGKLTFLEEHKDIRNYFLICENDEILSKLRKEKNDLIDEWDKEPDGYIKRRLEKRIVELADEIKKEKEKSPHEIDKDKFMKHHYTGHIPSTAYKQYRKAGGLKWLGDVSRWPVLLDVGQYGEFKVEFRQRGEKNEYVAYDESGEIKRDSGGNVIMMTDAEKLESNLPMQDTSIAAFIDNTPIGLASNEFGAVGVWVEEPYQKRGIGVALLEKHIEQRPDVKSGKAKIGQMTDDGVGMTKKYYDNMSKKHGTGWFSKSNVK